MADNFSSWDNRVLRPFLNRKTSHSYFPNFLFFYMRHSSSCVHLLSLSWLSLSSSLYERGCFLYSTFFEQASCNMCQGVTPIPYAPGRLQFRCERCGTCMFANFADAPRLRAPAHQSPTQVARVGFVCSLSCFLDRSYSQEGARSVLFPPEHAVIV